MNHTYGGFNSKLVRLKVLMRLTEPSRLSTFQFQTGSIKSSIQIELGPVQLDLFQFQTGSIKSISDRILLTNTRMFQFQTGSIKSLRELTLKLDGDRFNSKLVRLKDKVRISTTHPCRHVSIPNWFD